MQRFSISPVEMVGSLWRNRYLIKATAKREIQSRYRGSVMGIFWSILTPLFMLTVYTFVFSEVFKARWHGGSSSKGEFALLLFAGLIVFNIFSECLNKSPAIILSNVNYVKKVVYPLEILPVVNVFATLFNATVSLLVWIAAYLIFNGLPHYTIIYFPLIVIPLVFITLGLCWFITSLGVYLRDVGQFIGLLTTALMFMSPVFYSADILPDNFRTLMYLNPLTAVIEQTRNVLYWGQTPDFKVIAIYWVVAFVICWLGFAWFQKTRKGFADVL
ncbi:ABC transporter permease [Pantoea sp. KPR_PJ]|uniref:ABC transporter permease n=1 Tax=Pantoea sp. KPR_PJ TaxID=2738375 RepID=UPI0035283630